tara:strand:+ start:9538 stop:13218 length:3681 start_codon:yes stop_codon:yes gene_type:complete
LADQRITQLTALSAAGTAATDVLAIVDLSGSETKKITVGDLATAQFNTLASSSIDLSKLNQASTTKLGTAALADSGVTFVKIQGVNQDRILGRFSAGQGIVEEINCTAAGRAILDDADASAQRTTLGLGTIAVLDSDGATLTNLTITSGTITGITDLAVADGGTGASNAADARTNLGVEIGTNVQAFDAGLQSISGLTTAADQSIYLTAADTYATYEITAYGRSLVNDADATAARTTLGLGGLAVLSTVDATTITDGSVGTSELANGSVTINKLGLVAGDLAGNLITAGDISETELGTNSVSTVKIQNDAITLEKLQDATQTDVLLGRQTAGTGTYEEITCTAAGRALLDDINIAAQRTTLGLGALATLDSVSSAQITDLSIGTADLAENSVTIAKLSLNAQELAGNLIANLGIGTAQLATSAVETDKIANNAVTYAKIQNTGADDIILGRIGPGAGDVQEITCTTAGRALIDDVDAAAQRVTLGLGTLATQDGTFSGTHSGTSSGTNTGDQTITLTGDVTGTGTGTFATQITAGAVGTTELANDGVTYDKIQDTTTTDVVLGRSSAGGGTVEQISCTAAGRALLDDEDAAAQRSTLGLGDIATGTGTWVDGSSFSGTSSGTNTGDQTITLTGDVTGSGTGSFVTELSVDAVAQENISASAVTTAKINDDAITEAKLGDQSTSIVASAAPSGTGAFIGQGWFNTSDSKSYCWNGTTWTQKAGINEITITETTPIAIAVDYPDAYTSNLTITFDTQGANTVFAGPTTGADAAPTYRALVPEDLPDATATTQGVIQPGTGLEVTSGTLNHSNSVTGATISGITFDAQGHISAATALVASDIPNLDAAKIISGELATARIADAAITADKLASYSTAQIGESLPVADFVGQLFFNPLDKNFFLWDGNVWQSIGISAGAIILAGTYDANTNQIATVTGEGTAIGLSVGNALPSASDSNSNYYLVVSEQGTGTSPAPTVALAPPDLLLSTGSEWIEIDVSSTYTAQTASNVAFVPAASVGSTNVQSAIEEVSNECRNANNITSGTLAVDRGGTGVAAYAKGDLLAASATTTLSKLTVGTNGYILSANSTTTTGLEWIENKVGTVTSVTGTSPVQVATGTTTPVISVDTGTTSAAGILQLTDGVASSSTTTAATPNGVKTAYDVAAAALPKAGGTITGQVLFDTTASLVFEGASPDAFETVLAAANPTADHTVTLPNLTGTVALTSQLDDGTF